MSLFIDIATLTSVSATFYLVLLMLLFIFWQQNRNFEAIIWWCGFPFFRFINSIISSDTIDYDFEIIVYVGNLAILVSDTFLLIGCLKFTNKKVPWKIISAYLSIFILLCFVQHSWNANLVQRSQALVIFDTIPLVAAIYTLSRLKNNEYLIEKFFTSFWLVFGIAIYIYWILIDFDFENVALRNNAVTSLAFVYLSHIFVTVGLIILIIAEHRNKLITELKLNQALEHDLEETLEKAKAANEEKNQFLANMSHELRNPLNIIIGYAESLRLGIYGTLNDKQTEYVENISGGGELLLKLITDLLNLSDVEEGRVDILLEEVNLVRLFEKTLPLLREITGKESSRLTVINKIPASKDATSASVDIIRIKQILINFMSNAVKYSDDDTPITLQINDHDEAYFRISVKDAGYGIPEEHKNSVFEPFNRAGIDENKVEGIGVGLSIAKSLIEEMKGRIGFDSKVGAGSTFWIDIPKSKQHRLPIG